MIIFSWQTILLKYHTLFFRKIGNISQDIVVCCSRYCRFLRVKTDLYIHIIMNNNSMQLNVYWALSRISSLCLLDISCVVCWLSLQTVWSQIRPDRTSVQILIKTVWHSDGISVRNFWNDWFWKKSAEQNYPFGKELNVQRLMTVNI